MEKHFELSDLEFENRFKNCTLNHHTFTHEAHLRLAWIHLTKYGEKAAIENICSQLIAFVDFVGAKAKYNETLTIAAIKAVNHFVNKSDLDTFQNFILEFPRLKYNFKELMKTHYSVDIFNSESVKKQFVEPDLVPFD